MYTFLKAQASSILSTLFDLLTTIVFKEVFKYWYLVASVVGTIAGGIINFALNRSWVFDGRSKRMHKQIIKYMVTWAGNLLLTTSGVFIFTHYFGLSYIVSKVVSAVIIGVAYNYMMQKKFVFV